MVADYFTKPLQGALFYKLRDYIMNIDPSSEFHSGHRSVLGKVDLSHSDLANPDLDECSTDGVDVDGSVTS
jgi:hypothetical protein